MPPYGYTNGYTTEDDMRGKGEGAIYRDGRGLWTATVELPPTDGKRRRKVIRSKDKRVVIRKLTEMKTALAARGDLPTAGQTLGQWMTVWFEDIALKTIRPKTAATYRGIIANHIIPAIGKTPLDKLTAAHVRRLHDAITQKGLSSTTALQAHRILATALKSAEREGRVMRNVAALAEAPRKARPQLTALDVPEALKVMEVASTERLGSLFAAILLTGARQGELLGLELDRVTDTIEISWQLQRLSWEHGCGGECGRRRGTDCPKRKITAPADWESRHLRGGLWLTRPKSEAGWRVFPLRDPLKSILDRRAAQARLEPNPHGLLWTMPDGSPIDPRVESEMWDALLKEAGVPDVRVHDGRHSTVDLLFAAGVEEDLIMEIVGHSTRAQSRAYKSRGNQARLASAFDRVARMLASGQAGDVEVGAHDLHRHAELEAHAR